VGRQTRVWAHNITLTTRLVNTVTTPMLLRNVIFGNAAKEKALKVIVRVRA